MANTRQEAWDLIKEYNKEPFHRQHALTVEGCMRYFAKSLGYGDEEEFWDCSMIWTMKNIRKNIAA